MQTHDIFAALAGAEGLGEQVAAVAAAMVAALVALQTFLGALLRLLGFLEWLASMTATTADDTWLARRRVDLGKVIDWLGVAERFIDRKTLKPRAAATAAAAKK